MFAEACSVYVDIYSRVITLPSLFFISDINVKNVRCAFVLNNTGRKMDFYICLSMFNLVISKQLLFQSFFFIFALTVQLVIVLLGKSIIDQDRDIRLHVYFVSHCQFRRLSSFYINLKTHQCVFYLYYCLKLILTIACTVTTIRSSIQSS